jgi:hypothetical protein
VEHFYQNISLDNFEMLENEIDNRKGSRKVNNLPEQLTTDGVNTRGNFV